MFKFNLHARLQMAAIAMMPLGSCDESKALVLHDEAVDIADDSIDASGLPDRVDALEHRVEDLEASLN